MANNNTNETHFEPGNLYPLPTVAKIMQVSERWVKENLVFNDSCSYKLQGKQYFFRGEWIIAWASSDFTLKGDRATEVAE